MKKILLTISLFVSSIFLAYAQGSVNLGGGSGGSTMTGNGSNALLSLLRIAQTIVGKLVPFLIGVALLAFFWFLILFIWKGQDDPAKQQESMKGMGYSILAIFVMVSIWGIISFAGSILGINQGGTMPAFKLPGEQ